jgi:PST family polysaccharide transporter
MRRIRDMAALGIWGALLGTIFSIPIIYFFREKGIVPFLITVYALMIFTSWLYARKIKITKIHLPPAEVWAEARPLLSLGFIFTATGLMTTGTAYLVRVLVIREMGLHATGLYQAAFSLASVYVGFILSAMSSDYYPRLTAVAHDDEHVNRLVNEQTEISLLMALPGILGTLTFAPLVLQIFYSAQFEPAGEILRWQILGVLGRVISWPMGFVLLAKGRGKLFFFTELISNLIYLGMVWFGMKWFGLPGLGMAFFGLYIFYCLLIQIIVYKTNRFSWSKANLCLIACSMLATALVFTAAGGLLPAASVVLALRIMARRIGCASLPEAWSLLKQRLTRNKP